MKSFLKKIGNFFKRLFDAAERAWTGLTPEIQKALKQGSGVLSVINNHVDKAPPDVIWLIQKLYPELGKATLLAGLAGVANGLNIASDNVTDDLEKTVGRLQLYLSEKKLENAAFWAGITSLAAKILAFAFAPAGTRWAVFESLMEFVYQRFIKNGNTD